MTSRAAYGPIAQRFSASVPADRNVIVFDHIGAAEALRDCATRAFRGERFWVRPLLQRDFASRADSVAPNIMASFNDMDQRRLALTQAFEGTLRVSGHALSEIPAYHPAALRLMQAAVRLSDGVAVSSHAELRRLRDLLASDPFAAFDVRDRSVPPPQDADLSHVRDATVIWAPELPGDAAYAFVVALADLHCPILLLSATRPNSCDRATWVPIEAAREALKRARAVVITNAYGCDAAAALAAWAVPLIVDVDSGAQERLIHARAFDRRHLGSIFDAVAAALGREPARERAASPAMEAAGAAPGLMPEGPLVSIVMPTFNRPTLLRYALESCRRQSYGNIETIVAVGGGARFDELAANYPEVRFIHLEENVPVASLNAAFAEATGTYVTVLNDDDLFFPDHVAALVTALERSGCAAAHGDVLTAYLRGTDEQWLLYGFESNMSRSVDTSSMLVANRIGATSMMVRRSCISEKPLDVTIPYYRDYALWLSLSLDHDLVHVERITSCYTIRNQGAVQQSMSSLSNAVGAYEAIYDRYAVPDRPVIQQQRAQMLNSVRSGATSIATEPAMQITPVPWPLWDKPAS